MKTSPVKIRTNSLGTREIKSRFIKTPQSSHSKRYKYKSFHSALYNPPRRPYQRKIAGYCSSSISLQHSTAGQLKTHQHPLISLHPVLFARSTRSLSELLSIPRERAGDSIFNIIPNLGRGSLSLYIYLYRRSARKRGTHQPRARATFDEKKGEKKLEPMQRFGRKTRGNER